MRAVLLGLLIGGGIALGLTPMMKALLYGIHPSDPGILLSVPIFFLVIAAIAAYLPARRAANADPLIALRHE